MAAQEYTEAWLTGPQETAIYTRTYLPPTPKAAIVFIHGFAEHVGRYTHFHPLLAKKDIAVFAIDQRGFGLTALDTQGKKSKSSSWGKTCWVHQMDDINWAINHAKEKFKDIPLFLMGHSMGGGEVLGFATQEEHPHKSAISLLSGLIATSPLITQASPAPKFLTWIGGKVSILAPYTIIPADVKAEDPLIKQSGSLKGISDMLTKGGELIRSSFKRWPKTLPLLVVHGTGDKVTSYESSQTFVDSITADSKKLSLYEGGYHELQNEPDGVKERLAEEIIGFVNANLSQAAAAPASSSESDAAKPNL
ncbi:hypothetical protein EST38_g904 [Candolleomyces aberdarensis]|uniref:Serine aminopeptidase S33 domain-containing protein n=1 Tax=Candolleomyces aberdarensis TaxID=2316362 RepID=A0A4Q2DWC0_9AGAR|nr:hypothetical protein EST38_g904 [Candolleomyces aberdarensis]